MNKDIDREIAEKVMGWRLISADLGQLQWIDKKTRAFKCLGWPVNDWNPCKNIAQAFEVVEKIDSNYYVEILRHLDGGFTCQIFESAEGFISHACEEAETPAMAICLAALKGADGDGESGGDEET